MAQPTQRPKNMQKFYLSRWCHCPLTNLGSFDGLTWIFAADFWLREVRKTLHALLPFPISCRPRAGSAERGTGKSWRSNIVSEFQKIYPTNLRVTLGLLYNIFGCFDWSKAVPHDSASQLHRRSHLSLKGLETQKVRAVCAHMNE